MGKGIRYTDEFKQEAVNQVVVQGYSVLDVSKRLGITNKSLYDWIKKLLKVLKITPSMSRGGDCHDNAVAESFFANLKKEKIKRRRYRTGADARLEIFEYIELFYNPKRRENSGRIRVSTQAGR